MQFWQCCFYCMVCVGEEDVEVFQQKVECYYCDCCMYLCQVGVFVGGVVVEVGDYGQFFVERLLIQLVWFVVVYCYWVVGCGEVFV